MRIEVVSREVAAVVSIHGSIDGLTAGELLDALGGEIRSGKIRLVADFAAVDYISSAGLRAVLATMKDARQQGGDFRLAAVPPEVWKVLHLSGFTSIVKSFPDVESAVGSFAP
jgi:anti-anti-sigma factor